MYDANPQMKALLELDRMIPGDVLSIPRNTLETIANFVVRGTPMGGFCYAVVVDDSLTEAIARADRQNLRAIVAIAGIVYNCVPNAARRKSASEWADMVGSQPLKRSDVGLHTQLLVDAAGVSFAPEPATPEKVVDSPTP